MLLSVSSKPLTHQPCLRFTLMIMHQQIWRIVFHTFWRFEGIVSIQWKLKKKQTDLLLPPTLISYFDSFFFRLGMFLDP